MSSIENRGNFWNACRGRARSTRNWSNPERRNCNRIALEVLRRPCVTKRPEAGHLGNRQGKFIHRRVYPRLFLVSPPMIFLFFAFLSRSDFPVSLELNWTGGGWGRGNESKNIRWEENNEDTFYSLFYAVFAGIQRKCFFVFFFFIGFSISAEGIFLVGKESNSRSSSLAFANWEILSSIC